MQRLNTFTLVELGRWLDSVYVSVSLGAPLASNIDAWRSLNNYLNLLIAPGRDRFELVESSSAGVALHKFVMDLLKRHADEPNAVLAGEQLGTFFGLWTAFYHALSLDLGRAPIYFVTPKGIYSTQALTMYAENALAIDVLNKLPSQAGKDLSEAGRCLAFGVPTAAGYHAMRCTERVLRDYYKHLTGSDDVPRNRREPTPLLSANMGQIIWALKQQENDDESRTSKTLAVLDQIRSLHRNPLAHPDVFLESSEAMELFNIATGAVSTMIRQIAETPAKQPATAPGGELA
jgi:hypothetical protein